MGSDNGGALRVVGRAQRKVDAVDKVTGQTKFADDLYLPRLLLCKILRSPHPHARILRVDTSRAEARDGVHAVLVGADLPIPFGILPVSQDEHALTPDIARFIGDPVAAIAAVSEEVATEALDDIDVEYEQLDPIGSIEQAIANPEPRIHDYGDSGNPHKLVSLEFGNVEEGFEEADLGREDLFFYAGSTHLPMEQHATLAWYEPDGRMTIWSSTQTPHYLHKAAAKVLGLPPSRLRIVACPNGGGFGGKSDPFNHEIVVAKLARNTGRPVKCTLTREEVFFTTSRHGAVTKIWTGLKGGRITARKMEVYYDTGDSGFPYLGTGAAPGDSPIDVGNVTSFTLSGLAPWTTYYIAVTAYDAGGDESWYSDEIAVVLQPGVEDSWSRGSIVSISAGRTRSAVAGRTPVTTVSTSATRTTRSTVSSGTRRTTTGGPGRRIAAKRGATRGPGSLCRRVARLFAHG